MGSPNMVIYKNLGLHVNNILYRQLYCWFIVMICVGVVLSILYCWFVDIVDLLQKWYPTINRNVMNHHGDSRALWHIKNAAN